MLKQRKGAIVLIGSAHAYQGYPERLPYSIAKTAMLGLSRSLALEWGTRGVRTNIICPWRVAGPRTQRIIDAHQSYGEDIKEAYKQRSPMRQLISADDIAQTVLWIEGVTCGNGMEILLDGGVAQSMWYKPYLEDV